MTTWGANADELDAAAAAVERAADLLDANRVRLSSQVHHAPWRGWEADQFRREWDELHGPRLTSTAVFLREARARLVQNASGQRTASGTSTGALNATAFWAMPSITRRAPASALAFSASGLATSILGGLNTVTSKITEREYDVIDGGIGLAGQFSEGKDILKAAVHDTPIETAPFGVLSAIAVAWDGTKLVKHISSNDPSDALFDIGHVALDAAPLAAAVFFGAPAAVPVAAVIAAGTALWALGATPTGQHVIHDVEGVAAQGLRDGARAGEEAAGIAIRGTESIVGAAARTGASVANAATSAPGRALHFLRRHL